MTGSVRRLKWSISPHALRDRFSEYVGIDLPCQITDPVPDDVPAPPVEFADQHNKLRIPGFEGLPAGFGVGGPATTTPCDLLYETLYLAVLKSPAVHKITVSLEHV